MRGRTVLTHSARVALVLWVRKGGWLLALPRRLVQEASSSTLKTKLLYWRVQPTVPPARPPLRSKALVMGKPALGPPRSGFDDATCWLRPQLPPPSTPI